MSATAHRVARRRLATPSLLRQLVWWSPFALGSAIAVVLLLRAWTSTVAVVVGAVLLLAGAALLVANDNKNLKQAGSVLLALGAAAAPVVGAALDGGTLSSWTRIYVAGAAGGLVLELLMSRGQIELPGLALRGEASADDPRRPLLTQVDLGVLARLVLGGLAAVVVVMIGAASGAEEPAEALERAAQSDLAVAWAIAIGSSSIAVWKAIQRIVQARLDALETALSSTHAVLDNVKRQALAHGKDLAAGLTPQQGPDAASQIGEIVGAISAAQEHLRAVAKRRGVSINVAGHADTRAGRVESQGVVYGRVIR